ncbi:MAG TPA: glutamine--tRNA ligase/YqeY domain fusion protein [Thermotogota bacterium]|nr:glutamine--tRNA ligase/YqeY domain fusion protein [Thermotogota bacterium]HPJ90198.1 glutamine--tRNA ligase/YqeY domain fusion protein [Thermotogota bacterium]HPR97416.1 glutamine--tRNA ligase/YqeY domain fusion protein [Thermotogota bacterium]
MATEAERPKNFIEKIIEDDLGSGRIQKVITRFPPEPNAQLHIGHAKSILLNHGLARKYNGQFNLRFDDTNPEKEEEAFMESMKKDIRWLGANWDELRYASDYFDQFYGWAIELIEKGLAYVDNQTAEEIRQQRGTLKEPGTNSPYRDRTVEENLDLFEKMKNGEFGEGEAVLRAKIDMGSSNLNMRDPIMYRILKKAHYRLGNKWNIYPMYDFAHGYEDSIEGITHSICTLEFEDHRPLYNWFIENVSVPSVPHQYEFARLNLSYTVMSKRLLREIVETGIVAGYDDPRMPTISGLRRRGFTPTALKRFAEEVGVAKGDSMVDLEFLEYCLRDELNKTTVRGMAVLDPVKLVVENYPEDQVEYFEAQNNPENPEDGSRQVAFCRELYIEREDFMEDAPRKFFRMSVGREVRLKFAYYVTCTDVIRDEAGNITELRCTYDPESRGGGTPDGRRVKGTLHWVSARHARKAEVRVYDKLFTLKNLKDMEEGKTYKDYLNPESLVVLKDCLIEPMLAEATPGDNFQFMRKGYFCADDESTPENPVFNRSVALKDSWAKAQK